MKRAKNFTYPPLHDGQSGFWSTMPGGRIAINHRRGEQRQHLADNQTADLPIPNGRRSSAPTPVLNISGARQAEPPGWSSGSDENATDNLVDCIARRHALLALSSQREAIIMMAFFFTIPISKIMPIIQSHPVRYRQSLTPAVRQHLPG